VAEKTGIELTRYSCLDTFVATIALPEFACQLIMEDYGCCKAEVAHMAWLSEPYGETEFPFNPQCTTLSRLHTTLAIKSLSEMQESAPETLK
jgi:diadenosine tetraphosphatase ApaH/serine/threonine PP2A family protein phosphatase